VLVSSLLLVACSPALPAAVAPSVTLEDPGDLAAGHGAIFHAAITDDADAPADMTLRWTLDGAAAAGVSSTSEAGASLALEDSLAAGEHEVGLEATDLAGATGRDLLRFTVAEADAPNVRIQEPDSGRAYADTLRLIVQVKVKDADDDPTEVRLEWSGIDADGEPPPSAADAGGLATWSTMLTIGDYTLVVVATDPLGAQDREEVSFQVVAGDVDGDGYTDEDLDGTDCDDGDEGVHPGADERCDEVDDDCDGEVDEGCA
jgi:hypothetical protein